MFSKKNKNTIMQKKSIKLRINKNLRYAAQNFAPIIFANPKQ